MNRHIVNAFRLILIVAFLFWPPTFLYLSYNASKTTKLWQKRKGEALSQLQNNTASLLRNGLYREACGILKQSYDHKELKAFGVESDTIRCFRPENLSFEDFNIKEEGKIHVVNTSIGKFAYQQISSGKARALIADVIDEKLSFIDLFKDDPWEMSLGLAVDSLIAAWLVFSIWIFLVVRNIESMRLLYRDSHKTPFWFKPINAIASLFDSKNETSAKKIQIAASETISKLTEERTYYAETLEYAILDDIKKVGKSKINLPYKFFGTVARIDINGYSQFVYEGNRPFLGEMKRVFEWLAAEYAYRYHGLFEGRAGDMVVYVFLGNNAELRAAAFVRDFSEVFSSQRFSFLREQNVQLFVKSSISSSQLEMEASPSKFDFDGDALYLTDRMFGELSPENKKKNILVLFPAVYSNFSKIVKPAFETTIVSKKESALEVSYHDSYFSFDECTDIPQYFLGDEWIEKQLRWLVKTDVSLKDKIAVVNCLQNLKFKKLAATISSAWLDTLVSLTETDSSFMELKASIISLGSILVPVKNWKLDYSNAVISFSQYNDMRVAANAIEVLAKWNDIDGARNMFNSAKSKYGPSARLLANILLAECIHSLNETNLMSIIRMIKSKDRSYRESGVYAACVLILHLEENNSVAASTFHSYHKIKELLKVQSSQSSRIDKLLNKALGYENQNL